MRAEPGSYALVLRNHSAARIQIGRWRNICFAAGYYIYLGSALGPGGVRARVSRHCRQKKINHWHIDYLSQFARPIGAFYSHQPNRLEHQWAQALRGTNSLSAVTGFGCSDCRCHSHLFRTDRAPASALFAKITGGEVECWWSRPVGWEGQGTT